MFRNKFVFNHWKTVIFIQGMFVWFVKSNFKHKGLYLNVFSIIVLLLVSNLLILLATQLVNENNADLLLAGYNTMSKKEKEKFKLKEYLIFFKNFFFKLVLYSSLITIISSLFFDELYVVIIYSICILLPLPFFLIKSNKNFKK